MSRRAVAMAAAAVAIALVANAFLVDAVTRAAAPRYGGRLLDIDGLAANIRIEGQGPPVVLIHGISAALDWWDDIVPALATRHRVIRVDLIGHGGTAAPQSGYEIPRQAALVASVIDRAAADQVVVIGHSMGGQVATALTEARPQLVDRVVLIDSPPTTDAGFDLTTRAYLLPVVGQALSHLRTDGMLRRALAQAPSRRASPSRSDSSPTASR